MLTPYIQKILQGQSLSQLESHAAMLIVLQPHTSTVSIKNYLEALHAKGETTEEVQGAIMP